MTRPNWKMMKMNEMIAVVVGFGSIGKTHVKLLSEMTSNVVIVDQKKEVCQSAKKSYPEALVYSSLEELSQKNIDWKKVFAVLATWAPSHADLFHFFADRGVGYILCEKPLASSVADGHQIIHRARKENIVLGVHHYIRYIGFIDGLKRMEKKHHLGAPKMVLVQGGAHCLVNNGLHYIDLAIGVFEAEPKKVISTAKGDFINPRSPELRYYGGTAIISFDQDREAVIAFNNHSSLAESIWVYYRNAIVRVENYFATVTIEHRDRESLQKFPIVTRPGYPIEKIFQGVFPEMCSKNEGTKKLYREIQSGVVKVLTPETALVILSAGIGALTAGKVGKEIFLPIDPSSEFAQQQWPIN